MSAIDDEFGPELMNAIRQHIQEFGAAQKTQAASDLAGRGIYSSPVSEYALGQIRDQQARRFTDVLGQFASQIPGLKLQRQQLEDARQERRRAAKRELYAALAGAGSTFLGGGAGVAATGVRTGLNLFKDFNVKKQTSSNLNNILWQPNYSRETL